MNANKKMSFVNVSYEGYNPSLDKRLEIIAKSYKGNLDDSGYTLLDGNRDLSFSFSSFKDALTFSRRIRKWKTILSSTLCP